MNLPPLVKQVADIKFSSFCRNMPSDIKKHLKFSYRIKGDTVELYEHRKTDPDKTWHKRKIAQFRYDYWNNSWSLYFEEAALKEYIKNAEIPVIDPDRLIH